MKPQRIKKGDVIGIVSPASPPSSAEKIEKSANYFEKLGYRVIIGSHAGERKGFLAGSDKDRASDINAMFRNRHVKAIIAVRGGYGSYRILPKIDYDLIAKNPKILVGYSDITALQLAIYRKTKLVTFSGPMAGVEFWNAPDPFTEEHFWDVISSATAVPLSNPNKISLQILHSGSAEGRLLGGNLSLMCALLGSQYSPSYRNSILFFEEIEETAPKFDRMLNHLSISNTLHNANGVIIGELTDVGVGENKKTTIGTGALLQEYFRKSGKPVMTGLLYGHVPRKLTIPIGIRARLSSRSQSLVPLEPAVRS